MILYPFQDVLTQADEAIEKGGEAYQQFTCGGCDNKLTMEAANTFYTSGKCDQCGHVTDIKAAGCNLMVIFGLRNAQGT